MRSLTRTARAIFYKWLHKHWSRRSPTSIWLFSWILKITVLSNQKPHVSTRDGPQFHSWVSYRPLCQPRRSNVVHDGNRILNRQYDSDRADITTTGKELVIVRFSQIEYATISPRDLSVFFSLSYPPSYESGPPAVSSSVLWDDSDKPPLRTKASSLSAEGHQRIAPFVSFAIRFTFPSREHLDTFQKMRSIAHMRNLEEHTKSTISRNIFFV